MNDDVDYTTPEAEAIFEAIWRGERTGFSEDKLRASLAEHEQMLADLHAHRITPRSVVGTGYKDSRKVAVEWLTNTIEQYRTAIETRGRSDSINRSNVRYHLRRAAAAA